MKLLLLNLSHYLRRPMLILMQLLSICMTLPMVFASQKSNFWTPSLCGIAMIGGVVYGYQMEILSKPFSFMLPGHHRIFRRLIFLIQVFWLLPTALLILFLWPQNLLHRVYGCTLILGAGSMAFRLGTTWADKTRQPQAMIGLLMPVIVFVPMLLDSATVEKCLFNPLVIVMIAIGGSISTLVMWRRLGQVSLFRSYCELESVGFFSNSFQRNLQKARRQYFAIGAGPGAEDFLSGIDTFFLNRIIHTRHKPIASYAYGAIYEGLRPALLTLLRARGISILMVVLAYMLLGYYGQMGNTLVWIAFLFPVIGADFGLHSTLMMTRGRAQRYVAAITSLLFTVLYSIVIVFILTGLTTIIEPIMPTIDLRGIHAQFHVLSLKMWYIFAIGVPTLALLRLLFWNFSTWFFGVSTLMASALIFFCVSGLWHYTLSTAYIILILTGTWVVFTAYLYRVCFLKSLAGQN